VGAGVHVKVAWLPESAATGVEGYNVIGTGDTSEAVTNAFKPFPDAFLARVYALASQALGLNQFNRSIKEKLNLVNTLYTTLSDEADHLRSLRLEWIVIILILVEIIMGFSEKLLPLLHRG